MSFVTTALAEEEDPGFETPPDPCPHSGAATSAATSGIADHRARYLIPTSVEGRSDYSPAPSANPTYMFRPGAGSIAPIRHVDNHRPDVCPIEQVVEAHKGVTAYPRDATAPPEPHIRGPPGRRMRRAARGHGVVHGEPGRVPLLELYPGAARERRLGLEEQVQPVLGDPGHCLAVQHARAYR